VAANKVTSGQLFSNDNSLSSEGGPFTALQKNEIRNTVREYLLENPQVVVEVLESIQSQQQRSEGQQVRNAVTARADQLFKSRSDPSVGDPKASVTVVEFFDYQCPYCRRMAQQLAKLNEEDPDLRVVYKEFPVFGPASTLAASAAMGSATPQRRFQHNRQLAQELGIRGTPAFVVGDQVIRGAIEIRRLRELIADQRKKQS
jgi:protein-disulfide isomerase